MSGTTVPAAVMELINEHGGIQGLYSSFQKGGFGDVIQSWLGSGNNKQVGTSQLSDLLDQNVVQNVAQRTGIDPDQLVALASEYLPLIIENLTPNGNSPNEQSGFLSMAMNFFRNRGIG